MMNCKEVHTNLIFYLEQTLHPDKMHEIEEHLAQCPACQAELDFLASTLAIIDQEKSPQVNPFLATRIIGRIEDNHLPFSLPRWKRVVQPLVFTMLFVVAMWFGINLGASFLVEEEVVMLSDMVDPYLHEMNDEAIELFLINNEENHDQFQ